MAKRHKTTELAIPGVEYDGLVVEQSRRIILANERRIIEIMQEIKSELAGAGA